MTDKADIDRALADAIAELVKHGGTEAQVKVLASNLELLLRMRRTSLPTSKFRISFFLEKGGDRGPCRLGSSVPVALVHRMGIAD